MNIEKVQDFIDQLPLNDIILLAEVFNIPFNRDEWLDDEYTAKTEEVIVTISEAMMAQRECTHCKKAPPGFYTTICTDCYNNLVTLKKKSTEYKELMLEAHTKWLTYGTSLASVMSRIGKALNLTQIPCTLCKGTGIDPSIKSKMDYPCPKCQDIDMQGGHHES